VTGLPQARQRLQAVALEPVAQRGVVFRGGLNLLECCQLRLGRRMLVRSCRQVLDGRGLRRAEGVAFLLQRVQRVLRVGDRCVAGAAALLLRREQTGVGLL